jgi:hypothetical protein
VQVRIAEALWGKGELEGARQHYLLGLRQEPGNLDTLLDLGELLMEMGRSDEAGEKFRRAIELAPEQPAGYFWHGNWLMQCGRDDEAIAALENAGGTTDIYLPPAAPLPMPPSQAFLPITPTPVSDGTPTPEPETQADVPQLADDWSDEPSLTALIPESPEVTDAAVADVTLTETDEVESGKKRDRSSKDGKSQENQQSAYTDDAMGWSLAPVDLAQSAELPQTTDETDDATTETVPAESATATEPAPQYDPATGLEIDPATGLLIDPTTGYLLDLVNGRIIDPRTGYLVHPMTGLLIDPATGAQLDPVTLAIVIPAGFGSDTPEYVPGSDSMRGAIEGVVDDTYDDATYKVIPPTDGPTQPVGEIVVPTESGDALEIS